MFITSLTPEKATFSNGNTLTKEELTDLLVSKGYLNKGETLFVDAFWNQSDLLMVERVYSKTLRKPEWEYIERIGLPSNMYFGFGCELGDLMYELRISDTDRFCVFEVSYTWYVIKQFLSNDEWVEDWTKQMNNSLKEAKEYAELQVIC